VRVLDGDALVLDTGQSVRLVGIEAPTAPYRDREGDAGYETAKRLLEDMVLGREVELRYGGLTRDRYDRALAYVVTTDALGPRLWLNAEMVRIGGARVRVDPDTAAAHGPLLELKMKARKETRGLWEDGVWIIHDAGALPADAELCQLPDGTRTRARAFLRDGRLEVSHPLNLEILEAP
jgi:endonuclease YncB( thermonuclease family)